MQLGEEVFSRTYTVPWFGRDGLLTRDPIFLLTLADDHRFAPYGDNRLHSADVMIEWLVMKRCGMTPELAKRLCVREQPKLFVTVRRVASVSVPGGQLEVQPGSMLEFVYQHGLICVKTAGAMVYGSAGKQGRPDPRGDDHRPQRPAP